MRNHDGGTIPWSMSEMKPHGLVTSKDMTPEQLARGREDALLWAKQWERCKECGWYLSEEPKPGCTNHTGVVVEPELAGTTSR